MNIYKLEKKDRNFVDRHFKKRKSLPVAFLKYFIKLFRKIKNIKSDLKKENIKRRLHIYVRHVGENPITASKLSMRPQWFSHHSCFVNLLNTISLQLKNHSVTLNIFFDGNERQFDENFIGKYKEYRHIKFHLVESKTILDSWVVLLNYLRNLDIPGTDLIYILENDYIHQKEWVNKVLEVYESDELFDYVSLYDHPDRYLESESNEKARVISTSSHHWRTAPSTCASFIMTKEVYDKSYPILKKLQVDNKFFKKLNPSKLRLITPIPGLSTHGMRDLLSPTVDWESVIRR
jgi:hypothetical protein